MFQWSFWHSTKTISFVDRYIIANTIQINQIIIQYNNINYSSVKKFDHQTTPTTHARFVRVGIHSKDSFFKMTLLIFRAIPSSSIISIKAYWLVLRQISYVATFVVGPGNKVVLVVTNRQYLPDSSGDITFLTAIHHS